MAIAENIAGARKLPLTAGVQTRLPWQALVYLLCVVTPIWFNLGPLKLSVLRLFLLVMILPLIFQLLSGRFGRVLVTDILMFLHIMWATVALAVNNPDQVVTQIGSVGVEFIGGYVVARAYVRTPEAFLALCRWIVLIIMCLIPFAVYETLTGHPPLIQMIRDLPGIDSVTIGHQEKRLNLHRVQATFAHPIHFGLFCSVSVALTFVALKDVMSTPSRWILALLSGATGFLALSSGALLAIALQVALIAWATAFDRIRWRWWLLVGLFALAWVVVDMLSNRTPLQVFMSYATFSAHNAYWRSIIFEWGMKNVWANPLFGIGLNDWERPHFMYSGSMDNFWLVMAVRYGIPGFLFLATGYALAVFRIMRRNFDDTPILRHIRRAWVFTFLGLSFTLFTVHVWATIYSFVFFMFGAGIWLVTIPADAHKDTDPAEPPRDPVPRGGGGRRFSRSPIITPAYRARSAQTVTDPE